MAGGQQHPGWRGDPLLLHRVAGAGGRDREERGACSARGTHRLVRGTGRGTSAQQPVLGEREAVPTTQGGAPGRPTDGRHGVQDQLRRCVVWCGGGQDTSFLQIVIFDIRRSKIISPLFIHFYLLIIFIIVNIILFISLFYYY